MASIIMHAVESILFAYVPKAQAKQAQVDVRPADTQFAGGILTKRHVLVVYLIAIMHLAPLLPGLAMMVAVFSTVFPDRTQPLWHLPESQARLLFVISRC